MKNLNLYFENTLEMDKNSAFKFLISIYDIIKLLTSPS